MIPKISLENLKLSKIVCGTNAFVGITHRNNPFGILANIKRFKKPQTVAKIMVHLLQEHGVNCCVSSPRDKIYQAIKIVEKETGEKYYWLCTPSRRKTVKNLAPDVFKQIDWCYEKGVSVCMPHRDYTDHAIDKKKLVIEGYKANLPSYPELSAYIRDKGMIPGLSSHFVETVQAVQKNKYDAPLVIQPLNIKGFQSDTNPEHLMKIIQDTKIQILNIKPMAAGRIDPKEAFSFCLKNIKKNDFLAVGFSKYEQCMEDGKIIEEILNSSY